MLKFNTPLKRGVIFIVITFVYFLLGYLNYTRSFKIAFIGFFTIMFFDTLRFYFKNKVFNYLFYIVITVIFLNLGFQGLLRDTFGVAQDDLTIIQSIVDTDINETKEFLSQYYLYIIKHILLVSITLILYIRFILNQKLEVSNIKKTLWITLFFYIVIHLNPSMRRSDPFVYFIFYYNRYQHDIGITKKLDATIKKNLKDSNMSFNYKGKDKTNIVVWVIGESETKYNWSLYGYLRDTNKYIKKFQNEFLLIKNAKAAAPATVSAFELMFTDATKKNPDLWMKSPNIVQIANLAGYKTYWISNQTSDRRGAINIFANSADTVVYTNKGRARGEGSFDEVVLEPFFKAINDKANKKFIIIHLMGSHPAYDYRYPKRFSIYTLNFSDKVMKNLLSRGRSRFALVFRNLYDNSVLYSDYIRYKILDSIKNSPYKHDTTLIYHPDHGQDVCHNSNFSGHNHSAKQQWEIPMLLWGKDKKDFEYLNSLESVELDKVDKLILKVLAIQKEKNK